MTESAMGLVRPRVTERNLKVCHIYRALANASRKFLLRYGLISGKKLYVTSVRLGDISHIYQYVSLSSETGPRYARPDLHCS